VWIYKGDIVPYKAQAEDKIAREAAMAVGETSRPGARGRVVHRPPPARPGRRRRRGRGCALIKEADPELEKLLDEEEEIARRHATAATRPRTSVGRTDRC
jgi:small subunit ribosomal protein S3